MHVEQTYARASTVVQQRGNVKTHDGAPRSGMKDRMNQTEVAGKGSVLKSETQAELLMHSARHSVLLAIFYLCGALYLASFIEKIAGMAQGIGFFVICAGLVGHLNVITQSFVRRHRANAVDEVGLKRHLRHMELNSFGMGALWFYLTIFVMMDASPLDWRTYCIAVVIHLAIVAMAFPLVGRAFFIHTALVMTPMVVATLLSPKDEGSVLGVLMMAGFQVIMYLRANDLRDLTQNLLSSRDESKTLNAALSEANKVAVDALAVKDQFLTNISHEIRNPMQSIIGTLELFEDDDGLTVDRRNALSGSKTAVRDLNEMMTQLLDMAALNSGRRDNIPEKISVKKVVQECLNTHRPRAQDKGIDLRIQVPHTFHPHVYMDPRLLKQVVNNLVTNAVKFTLHGEIVVSLRSQLNLSTNEDDMLDIIIEVRDTGIGIPEAKLAALFDPYTRGQNAVDLGMIGTGLGLSIVRTTVQDLLHGEIQVESKEGEGSCFVVTLTAARVKAPRHAERTERKRSSVHFSGKALVVEDGQCAQIAAKHNLEAAGMECFVAGTGEAALQLVLHNHFDIILMDCHLPGKDGFETTRNIREVEARSNRQRQHIIAVTADVTREGRGSILECGMDDHLAKPYEHDKLYSLLSRYLKPVDPVKEGVEQA